jgi:DNA-binding PucR family transcriptional regulator
MDILKKEILANPFLKFYKVGFSMPFRSIEQLSLRYRQASFAFSKGENEKYSINFCKEYAFNYLTEQLFQQSKALELLHPALNILEEYDLKKNTKLYETLYQYLINERNLVCTAKKLFIHRNSLLYRIQRISKLTKSDFDSDVERLHMLLSYEIMKNLR